MSAAVKEIEIQTSVTEEFEVGSLEVTVRMELLCDDECVASSELIETEEIRARKALYICSEKEERYLWAQLTDRDGKEMDRIFPVPVEAEIQFCMQANMPILWNAECPYLYDLVLELRDGENRLLGCAVKKIAFQRWENADGTLLLNGKEPRFRVFPCTEITEENLTACKRSFCNTIFASREKMTSQAQERCLEYGIYLLNEKTDKNRAKRNDISEKNPDFELNVVNQGVLIENKSTYVNVNQYELYYSLRKEGADSFFSAGITETDIAAGVSRYVELPFDQPDEPGNYVYRAALRLKEKTPWADQGAEIAVSESKIANLFCKN